MSGSTEVADLLPVLRIPKGAVTPYVLTVGEPERASAIAALLAESREVGRYREYWSFQGRWQGVELTVTSHGVGAAGAAIAFTELIEGGARTLVRLGTAGSFLPQIRSGDLMIATGAVRDEGVSERILPLGYPAIADLDVTLALRDAAEAHAEVRFGTGIMLTRAAFYPGPAADDGSLWRQAHVVGVELELATLLVIAGLRGARAGGIFTIDGNPGEDGAEAFDYNPHRPIVEEGKRRMIAVGLDAILRLAASGGGAKPGNSGG